MKGRAFIFVTLILGCPCLVFGERCFAETKLTESAGESRTRYVEPTPRHHELSETATYLGGLYAFSGLAYYVINFSEVNENANIRNFSNNVGRVTFFDEDLPSANWMMHVFTGALGYEFYRARSYSKTDAFLLTALQSALFELTVEVIQEPASLEDLINTPVLGSLVGRGLELASFPLLNSEYFPARILGHLLNLPTVFGGLYEGRTTTVVPVVNKSGAGFALQVRF